MSIEQDIKQEKFGNEYDKAAVNILFTGSWLSHINSIRLKKYGITPEQYNVLRILRGSHPGSLMLAEVTARMIDKSTNSTPLVEKLPQNGYLNREQCKKHHPHVN